MFVFRYSDIFVGMATMGADMTDERLRFLLHRAFQVDSGTSLVRPAAESVILDKNNEKLTPDQSNEPGEVGGQTTPGQSSVRVKVDGQMGDNRSIFTCELMVHPGYPCVGDASNAGPGDGPDDFSRSEERLYEMGIINGLVESGFYRSSGITLSHTVSVQS